MREHVREKARDLISVISCNTHSINEGPLKGCDIETVDQLRAIARRATHRLSIKRNHVDLHKDVEACRTLLSKADAALHVFPFKDVAPHWKQVYCDASLLKALLLSFEPPGDQRTRTLDQTNFHEELTDSKDEWIQMIVSAVDMAFIMTGLPGPDREAFANELLVWLEYEHDPFNLANFGQYLIPPTFSMDMHDAPKLHSRMLVNTVKDMSLEAFERHMNKPRNPQVGPEPLIITIMMTNWHAFQSYTWRTPAYLLYRTFSGRRLVPIEIGRSYVAEFWGQKIIPFKDYLFDYVLERRRYDSERQMGYLAQYDLLKQIPQLRKDVGIPDYCFIDPPPPLPASKTGQHSSLETPQLSEPIVNAWIGPRDTVSPLHHDPYHNILVQVVGSKYVRLYSPLQTPNLYPREFEGGIDMRNTSKVDLEAILRGDENAYREFPRFASAPYVECFLNPGDMLYIPVGWWHFVRSLTVSISVSYWWN